MVAFQEFWQRLKAEWAKGSSLEAGVHVLQVRKWSQRRGEIPGEFTVVWKGGDTVHCSTATTDDWRNIAAAEFREVYETWPNYRSGRKGRSFVVHDLGVQNATWIIPILHQYEQLMD